MLCRDKERERSLKGLTPVNTWGLFFLSVTLNPHVHRSSFYLRNKLCFTFTVTKRLPLFTCVGLWGSFIRTCPCSGVTCDRHSFCKASTHHCELYAQGRTVCQSVYYLYFSEVLWTVSEPNVCTEIGRRRRLDTQTGFLNPF